MNTITEDRIVLPNGWTMKVLPVLETFPVTIGVDEESGRLARFTGNVIRIPASRILEVRPLLGTTAEDRCNLLARASRLAVDRCRFASGLWWRFKRRRDGNWGYSITIGSPIDDPLIQLELEMMIDLERAVA